MKKKDLPKNRLFEFDCEIYHRKLWIIVDNQELAQTGFTDVDTRGPIEDCHFVTAYAITANAVKNDDKYLGVLIHFNKGFLELDEDYIQESITHEAIHALDFIFDDMNIQYSLRNDEPAAYMGGWIALKCWSVLKNYVNYGRSNKNTTKR